MSAIDEVDDDVLGDDVRVSVGFANNRLQQVTQSFIDEITVGRNTGGRTNPVSTIHFLSGFPAHISSMQHFTYAFLKDSNAVSFLQRRLVSHDWLTAQNRERMDKASHEGTDSMRSVEVMPEKVEW